MRRISLSLLLLSAMMIGISSCSDDNENEKGLENGTATMTVTLKGQPATRFVGDNTTNPAVESVISNCAVYVFNYTSGDFEASKDLTQVNGSLSCQISGLSTGTGKRVVALVNVPTDLNLSNITTYSRLKEKVLSLDSQNSADLTTVGLFMIGESPEEVQLVANGNKTVAVPVSRRAAKIVLKSVIVNADLSQVPNFSINKVSVQKARMNVNILGDVTAPSGDAVDNYFGGIATPAGIMPNFSNVRDYLTEALTFPADYTNGTNIIDNVNQQKYFYVLPNNGVDGNGTLVTLVGQYGTDAEEVYYPFLINSVAGSGNMDGKFIESNKVYELSIVIKNPSKPSEDPNLVPEEGTLEVTVTPMDWAAHIDQSVEW